MGLIVFCLLGHYCTRLVPKSGHGLKIIFSYAKNTLMTKICAAYFFSFWIRTIYFWDGVPARFKEKEERKKKCHLHTFHHHRVSNASADGERLHLWTLSLAIADSYHHASLTSWYQSDTFKYYISSQKKISTLFQKLLLSPHCKRPSCFLFGLRAYAM